MSFLYILALFFIALAAVLVLAFLGLIWYIFQRPLARVNGEMTIADLEGEVEIVRDRWGVPHVYAAREHDVYRAQGFLHAQDRLFQMEYARRLGRGTMAEVFGAPALEADRWSRVIGFWRSAKSDLPQLSEADVGVLRAYAAGVNAFIHASGLRRPAEFTILGIKPQAWIPEDSLAVLKVLGWALSQNWESEVLRVQLLQHLGPERLLELEPDYPAASPVSVPADGNKPGLGDLATAAGRMQEAYQDASQWFGRAAGAGSNSWVISGERTATRLPVLANDPHLTLSMPTLFYQNHLVHTGGSLQITGASLPGLPGVIIGHNARIGWGVTAGRADTQDLFIEQPHPEEPVSFRCNDHWEVAEVLREEIAVFGREEPYVEEVVITRHGPLVNGLLSQVSSDAETPPASDLPKLALQWTGHAPSTSLRGLLALQKATDWPSFQAALADITEPSLNFVYGDVEGNIGYQYAGRIPRRRAGHGLVPSPGWDDSHDWEGWVSFDHLPRSFNPAQGLLLSANNKPMAGGNPPFLGADWMPGYRATRIERLLRMKPRFTVRDFQRMQMDVYSVQAEALVPFLITIDGRTALENRIIRELETWNLRVEVDSFAAAAYEVFRLHLLDLVFGDKLGLLVDGYKGQTQSDVFVGSGFTGKASLCLVNLLEQEESWWFENAATGEPRTRHELLAVGLRLTAETLRELIGKDPRKWAWGKVHQVEFAHLLGRGRLLKAIFNRGQYPIAGDEQTVWMTAHHLRLPFGLVNISATYRQVLDMSNWDRSTAILSTGQSGQPGSPHYADHIDMWREGDQHPMLWTRAAIDRESQGTLWLRPPNLQKDL